MSILDRKLLRDAWNLRSQVVTIAAVMATGVAVLVGSVSTYVSLLEARDGFYRESRFADLWADVERAPRTLLPSLAETPGVAVVEARIVKDVRVAWPRSETSVAGRIVSIPARSQPELNRLRLVGGRWPEPARRDDVLVSAGFAEHWAVAPGNAVTVILNGRLETFHVAGVAQSPEFVYASRQGSPLPDDRGFVVLWANEETVAAAFDMNGAFNSLSVATAPGANPLAVAAQLDGQLDRYGARGAYERRDQASHRFLEDELAEQRTLAVTVPLVFFAVAAFLLNVVLGRIIDAQREQIAALKALGFPSGPIALHYLKFAMLACALASLAGLMAGVWYGRSMLRAYEPFFRFPEIPFVLPIWVPATAIVVVGLAATGGVLGALRRVLALKPAEAMRAAVPAGIGKGLAGVHLRPSTKMIIRGVVGRPVRSALTVVGLAMALPVIVLGLFWWDALDVMVEVQFDGIERGDAVVTFTGPVPERAVREIGALPGVVAAEGLRIVPVRLRAGHRSYRLALTGIAAGAELRAPRDVSLRRIPVPVEGLMLSSGLAERLGVYAGSLLSVEVLDGERPVRSVRVAALVDEVLGFSAYMEIDALGRLLREGELVSHVALRVDPAAAADVWKLIADRPRVEATSVKKIWLQIFDEQVGGILLISAVVLTLFGIIIAVSVVYNAARVVLQERAWELASLRILGFTRAEVSRLLLAGLAFELLLAVPLGLLFARYIVAGLMALRDNESFTIPPAISSSTYASAALVVIAAGLASGLVIRRKVDTLDLVSVLKAKD